MDKIDVKITTEKLQDIKPERYADSQIDEMVQQLKTLIINNNYLNSKDIEQLSKKIALNSKDYLDSETYYWVMFAYYLKYDELNIEASKYVMIRLMSLIKQINNKERKPRALTFKDFEFDKNINNSIFETTKYVEAMIKKARIRFLLLELGLGLIFMGITYLLIHLNLLTLIAIVVVVITINYFLSFNNVKKSFIQNEMLRCQNYCKDEELIIFDKPIINS